MNQETSQNSNPQQAPGALLKQAKITANFSSEQVALRLNLTVELITSIENDNYQDSISPAFYRGYLRSYAQMVNIDADQLIELYNEIVHEDSLSAKITPTFDTKLYSKKDRSYPYFKWIAYLFVASIVVFAAYFIWDKKIRNNHSAESEINLNADISSNQANIPLSVLDVEEEQSQQSQNSIEIDESLEDSVQIQPQNQIAKPSQTTTANTSSATTATALGSSILDMDFKGDCWVKVTDANGEVLAIGIKRLGKTMSLEGMAPFSVILGNAGVVTMRYNNQDIDLSGFPAGNRVELQISADSELIQ
jgi:cytoskeleton protein RodZ